VIVYGNGHHFFGIILTDHIFVEEFFDLYRFFYREFEIGMAVCFNVQFLLNDLTGMFHAIFADMAFLSGNEDFYFIATSAAERTM
jgi:hypothetical protein